MPGAFYGGLAWVFAALTTAIAVAVQRRPGPATGGLCIVAGAVQLIIAFLAFKGAASMSAVIDGLPYIRLGSILLFGGFVLVIMAGILQVASRTAQAPAQVAAGRESSIPVTV